MDLNPISEICKVSVTQTSNSNFPLESETVPRNLLIFIVGATPTII
jgi:hypothetical protein